MADIESYIALVDREREHRPSEAKLVDEIRKLRGVLLRLSDPEPFSGKSWEFDGSALSEEILARMDWARFHARG